MKKQKIIGLAEVALFSAIAFVLDLLATLYSGFFPSGGSISLAIIPIVILSFRRGPLAGVIGGLIVGLLDLTDGFYTVADTWYNSIFQIGLDYIFTYMLVGAIGLFKPLIKKININVLIPIATFVAGLLKYLSHFLSGILFWPQFPNQPLGDRIAYSLVYNGGFMIPTIVVTVILSVVLVLKFKKLFLIEKESI